MFAQAFSLKKVIITGHSPPMAGIANADHFLLSSQTRQIDHGRQETVVLKHHNRYWVSHATESTHNRNMPTQKIPKYGWVRELENAESAAKKSRAAGAQLRLAIAAYKLRDFKKLKVAANLGLALDPSEGEKEQLKQYIEKSKEKKEMRLDRNILLQHMSRPGGAKCDRFYISSSKVCPFTNLNILQFAVSIADVTLMEEVVALGAALDIPVSDRNAPHLPTSFTGTTR
jgi:hypothetical protein